MKIRYLTIAVLFGPAAVMALMSAMTNGMGLHEVSATFANDTITILTIVIALLLAAFCICEFGPAKARATVRQFCCQLLEVKGA